MATRPPLELVDGGIPGDGRGIAKRSQVPKWYKDLAWNYDKAGEPRDLKASKAAGSLNAAMILTNDQRWKTQAGAPKLQWDSFSLRMTVEDPPWKTPRATLGPLRPGITEWVDTDDTRLQHWLFIEYDLNVSDAQVTAALKQVSRAQEHHPVREYLAGLTWDGTPRIERWLIEYFGCDDTPYARSVGRRWLTSAVARVMWPGCQADYMLVLEGSTGIGKSTALAALCPSREWFGDSKLDLGSKDRFTSLRGNWIREWGEMGELKSARDIDTAKSFVTSTVDKYRPPYGRSDIQALRQCVFAGTTEDSQYISDVAARRWWPVRCRFAKAEAIAAIRDQLWAEARWHYEQWTAAHAVEFQWWPPESERAAFAEQQADRLNVDSWSEVIGAWLAMPSRQAQITVTDVFSDALGLADKSKHGYAEQQRVARVLRAEGWERHRAMDRGRRHYYYERPRQEQSRDTPPPGRSDSDPAEIFDRG